MARVIAVRRLFQVERCVHPLWQPEMKKKQRVRELIFYGSF